MKVLISGASGLIGSYVSKRYIEEGHHVIALTRRPEKFRHDNGYTDVVKFDYKSDKLPSSINNTDLVINLMGKNLVTRWTRSNKNAIYNSRVKTTKYLVEELSRLSSPPKMLESASAIGFYNDTEPTIKNENSSNGFGYLPKLCLDWENEALKAESFGINTSILRIGIVISKRGGALPRMLLPFKFGLGSKFGHGKQIWSWIHIEDVFRAIEYIRSNTITGPINIVSPKSVTQENFGRELAKVLNRPYLFSIPGNLLKIGLGEMSIELLSSKDVSPTILSGNGFEFQYSTINEALISEIEKSKNTNDVSSF